MTKRSFERAGFDQRAEADEDDVKNDDDDKSPSSKSSSQRTTAATATRPTTTTSRARGEIVTFASFSAALQKPSASAPSSSSSSSCVAPLPIILSSETTLSPDMPSSLSSSSSSSLFIPSVLQANAGGVPGLYVCEAFLTPSEELEVIDAVETTGERWKIHRKAANNKSMHVKSFGPSLDVDYKVMKNNGWTPLPSYTVPLIDRMKQLLPRLRTLQKERESDDDVFDQLFVNKYDRGAVLPAHVDERAQFEEVLAGVSLLGTGVMTFAPDKTKTKQTSSSSSASSSSSSFSGAVDIFLPRGSLYFMTGHARYRYTHEIRECAEERISLTFRTIKPAHRPLAKPWSDKSKSSRRKIDAFFVKQ